jgi:NDP-sugar pyrophosphorylase family protein
MITQAIISAGGLGTRLRPTTDAMPKPMIPILGKPMLEWHVEQFRKFGVTEFFITLYYLPNVVKDYFGDGSKFGVRMHYFVEDEPLGTAGAIKEFASQLDNEFFYIYGDTFSLVDYGKMEKVWQEKSEIANDNRKKPIGMQRVGRSDHYADVDVAEIDGDGRMIKIHPKPHVETYPNAYRLRGAAIFNKKVISYIPATGPYEIGKQLLPAVIAAGELFYGYECDDYSKGIDTIEKWHEVEEYLKKHNNK